MQPKNPEETQERVKEQLILYGLQVSGKSPKFLSKDKSVIYKAYCEQEAHFFKQAKKIKAHEQGYLFTKFLPNYKGELSLEDKPSVLKEKTTENEGMLFWLNHLMDRYDKKVENNKFILLQNVTQKYTSPNVFDIKVGKRPDKEHKINEAARTFRLKLNGMRKQNERDKDWFRSKYMLYNAKEREQIMETFAFFVHTGKAIDLNLLRTIIKKLKQLALAFRSFTQWQFISSSVCIFYDADDVSNCEVKFIDFGRSTKFPGRGYDADACLGIENIVGFFVDVQKNIDKYKDITFANQTIQGVVPEEKIKKFAKH